MSSKKRIIEESDDGETPDKRARVAATIADSDDDVPISQLVKKAQDEKKAAMKTDDSDDSDDDIPIAELIRRKNETEKAKIKPAVVKPRPNSAPAKPPPSNKPALKKSTPTLTAKSSSSRPPSRGDARQSSVVTDSFYAIAKGRLVQKLLVRWWYVITWPDPKDVSDPAPAGFEALGGFPGVFVSTSVESMGTILDRRNKKTCPSLRNLSAKSSGELKDLCIRAIEEQLRQLVEAEGPDTRLERSLKAELREVKSVNADKADKEAAKLFKTAF